MIFVTVGNARNQFQRLLNAVDKLVESGALAGEEVIVQRGHTEFHSNSCTIVQFVDSTRFGHLVDAASAIIAHAGAGTILDILAKGKRPVVFARIARLGEHIDDHQVEFARQLKALDRIEFVDDPNDLQIAIQMAKSATQRKTDYGRNLMINLVRRALEDIDGNPN